ncbi:MAG: hypothetical protein KatS3mg109_0162 [Pirellulaceae bacterium]|nr:MAG: hypothetical protein KatS3mg109_0162 [Pirellulaceae bacterium]
MVLNPDLLNALRYYYGDVRVKRENQPADIVREIKRVTTPSGRVKTYVNYRIKQNGRYGETYVMDCPFCSDTRKRFSVSYLFGKKDPETGRPITFGLHCFNEANCHADSSNRYALLEKVQLISGLIGDDIANTSDEIDYDDSGEEISVKEVTLPGKCIPLTQLSPGHPAVDYLIGRGIDPHKAAHVAGALYVEQGYYWASMSNRLLIPFYRGTTLIGWTARQLEDDGSGKKYLNSSGSMLNYLYGLKGAVSGDVCVIVEGPLDQWSVGRPAVALLTKSLGYGKAVKLRQALLASEVKLIVVLLDPKQSEADRAAGHPHQIDALCGALKDMQLPIPHIPVWLPEHLDPGAAHGKFLAHYMKSRLEEAGYGDFGASLSRDVLSTSFTVGGSPRADGSVSSAAGANSSEPYLW